MKSNQLEQKSKLTKERIESFVKEYADVIKYTAFCISTMSVCSVIGMGIYKGYNSVSFEYNKFKVCFNK